MKHAKHKCFLMVMHFPAIKIPYNFKVTPKVEMYLCPPKQTAKSNTELPKSLRLLPLQFAFLSYSFYHTRHESRTRISKQEIKADVARDWRNDEADAEVVYPVDTRSYNGTHVANGHSAIVRFELWPDMRSL